MRINLTDNNMGLTDAEIFCRKDISALFPFADKTIAQLCKENDNLLIFPCSVNDFDDKIGSASVISLLNTDDPEKVQIKTGNVMGFIGVGDIQIKIKSRFDAGRNDYLLHYMLQKVLSFNLFDLNHNNDQEDVFDFAMFLFPCFLKNAMRQGMYREYRNFKFNNACVRGAVDISRHIVHNVPFAGNVAYSTREYSCDNSMTELIRHTVEFMMSRKYGQAVLNADRETIENVRKIVEYTPSYKKNERCAVISKNLRHKIHPYYTEYLPLQSLCIQILTMEGMKYGENDGEISGILFDGAWLWEEYVNRVLQHEGFTHPENKKRNGAVSLFEDGTGIRYPDFYKKGDIVLDAKYKKFENYERVSDVGRDDLHQIITYVANIRASRGGFVVPLTERQLKVPMARLKNPSSTLFIIGIEICKTATSYADFCQKMEDAEDEFVKSLNQQ